MHKRTLLALIVVAIAMAVGMVYFALQGSEPAGDSVAETASPPAPPPVIAEPNLQGAPPETAEPPVDAVPDIEPGAGPPPDHMPPAAAADPPEGGIHADKVVSYFQRTKTKIDASKAFGFVLLPKVAVTATEKQTQMQFCDLLLASLDYLSPGAVAARNDVLVTYWPIVPERETYDLTVSFVGRRCDKLLAWYDHSLARKLAAKAGVAELSGPLLITWPAGSGDTDSGRDPLIVDFSRANYEHAQKALQYWFRQLKNRPDLWTSKIREGTIRAELADAVNETAGVMLAMLAGKWESLTEVVATP